jgi:hypothetical protein
MMITPLYRLSFKPLLKHGLKQKFKYVNKGKSLSSDEAQEVLSLNLPYYEEKLQQELDLAFDLLKKKAPWLNTLSWLFVLALFICAGSLLLWPLSDSFMALTLAAGIMAFGIVIGLLIKGTRLFSSKLVDDAENTPARLIAIQIPLCLTQVQLALGVFASGVITLSILSIITAISIFVIAVSTQLSAMTNFILRLDLRVLDQDEVREYIKNTAPLYSCASKAWLLSESMEGMNLSVGIIQSMQGKDRTSDGVDQV